MRICDDLRQAVLQAAIQGDLVSFDSSDNINSTNQKLVTIRNLKAKLIKEGTIKKQKQIKFKFPEDILFTIPKHWSWITLDEAVSVLGDGIHGTPTYDDSGEYFFVNGNNLFNGTILIKPDTKRVNRKEYEKYKKELNENTIFVSINGTIGNIAFYNGEAIILGKSACYFNLLDKSIFSKKFLYYFFKTEFFLKYAIDNATGTTIKNVSLDVMRSTHIPLPPLAEQHRIVARVEELMARIDDLEKTETELEKLKAAFPDDMKAALLQAAMQGKLTEQLPEDGDAADLINQIAKEKSQLIKEGKIKKEKPLPEITPDEMPFDIPENWQWVRHNAIFDVVGGSQPAKSFFRSEPEKGYVRLYQIRDYGETPVPVYVPNDMVSKFTEEDDILLARYGGSLGKVFKAHKGAYNVALARVCFLFLSSLISKDFLYYYYLSPLYQNFVRGQSNGRSAQGGFNKTDLISLLFPLPPLAEQKRIVEKLDKLLPLCDGLVEE